MRNKLRTILILSVFICISGRLLALNPPPANDSVWDATNLGVLSLPPVCPAGGYGTALVVNGTTSFASYNSFDFSPAGCYASGSPDVWYRFTATSSSTIIETSGFNGLDTFFVKVFYSQGSCYALVPLACETSVSGLVSATFQTPDVGEEYYIEIGGNDWYKTGDFTMTIKTVNICNECVKQASVHVDPAPWYGRYGTSDTVKMCYTVDRWDYLGSSNLHAIVPRFGADWDMSTLTPVIAPQSYSANNGWHWFNNISTPDGPGSGYFFDPEPNNDPTDNAGDSAGVLASWTGCWKIATLSYCNTYDLSVTVNAYSDNETGTGQSVFACDPQPALRMGFNGWCCPSPDVYVVDPLACNTSATVTIVGVGNTGDIYNFTIYDTAFQVVGYFPSVFSTTTLLAPGDYNVEAYNVTSGCIGFATISVDGFMEMEIKQTAIGCGSGTASLIALPNGGFAPYTYNFINLSTALQIDSAAYQVPDGWQVVSITDITGCIIYDSIFVVSEPMPDAGFDFGQDAYCVSNTTVAVGTAPLSTAGTYTLYSPVGAGISVDPVTGEVDLSSSTLSAPYWVFVKYVVGSVCQTSALDSFQVVPAPAAPTVVGNAAVNYCIGSGNLSLNVVPPSGTYATWYDSQFNLVYVGNSYLTPLNGSTAPGIYQYGSIAISTSDPSCISSAVIFSINALEPPYFNISADTTICPGDMATISIVPCSTCVYTWFPAPTAGPSNTSTSTTSPASTTTYTMTAVNQAGCSFSLYTTVNVDASGSCGLTIYSGLTPNGDGLNDIWVIEGIEEYSGVVVSIYNRWGKIVWQHANYDNSESGTVFRGRDQYGTDLPDGTYFYIITGDNLNTKGWLELSH